MNILPVSFNNIESVSIQNNRKQLSQNKNITNPVQQTKLPMPAVGLLQAYSGVKTPVREEKKQDESISTYDYLLTLPNVQKAFKNELKQVADVIDKNDEEALNTRRMVDLVADGTLWRGVLRYFCANGEMSENTAKDINLVYQARKDNVNPVDRYVPTVKTMQDGIKNVKIGDTFEVEGEKNIFFKDADDEAYQLKISKPIFAELFPPVERFACVQGAAGDCYLLSAMNAMIDKPETRGIIYNMFEETDNSINVQMPNGDYVYSVDKNNITGNIDKWQHMQGAKGLILAEHTYGEELKFDLENEFYSYMNSEIKRLTEEEPENTEKIEGYKKRLADFEEKSQDENFKPVFERFENPDANGKLTFKTDKNGVLFRDLASSNKEVRRKLITQADFYRGSIGGDLDVVMKKFGFKDVEEYKLNDKDQTQTARELLMSEEAKNYIFIAGSLSDGSLTEKPIAKDYSLYSSHAYKIEPFDDENGERKFYVENPWNSTQNTVMKFDRLQEFFEVICSAKVNNA